MANQLDDDLHSLAREELIAEVERLRAGIRAHRDASGHELCWHHPRLWGLLPEKTDPLPAVPDWPQFLRGCLNYRQSLDRELPHAPRSSAEFEGGREPSAGLAFEMTYRLRIKGPLDSTKGSPTGEKQYWEMSEGTLSGARIRAKVAMPGGDWMAVAPDGAWRPDVRLQFVSDDGEVILLHYTGLVRRTERFEAAARDGRPTDWVDQYMRMWMTFETGAARYRWLTESLFLAEGRLAGPGELEYRVYRVI